MRVEVPEVPRVTEDTLSKTVRPLEGTTEAARFTVPVKPLRLVAVMVDESEPPLSRICRLVRLASILKSTTRRVMGAEWSTVPTVPVSVTL